VQVSKEGRARLVKLMMRRNTSVLSAMNDREIQQIAQKSTILQASHKMRLPAFWLVFPGTKRSSVLWGRYTEMGAESRGVLSSDHTAAS
jgi:hypothetical protein